MKIKKFINRILERMTGSVRRFKVTLGFAAAFTVFFTYLVIIEDFDDVYFYALTGLFIGGAISLLLKVADENVLKINDMVNAAVSLAAGIGTYFLLKLTDVSVYTVMILVCVVLAACELIRFCLYRNHDERKLFPYLFKSAVYCLIITTVWFAGIMIALMAFHFLIMEIDHLFDKILSILFVSIEGFMTYSLFISFLPDKDGKPESLRSYDIIVSKAGLYVYLLLIAILYGYIIKIIVTRKMPIGRLNWFGCIALLFYVFFYLNVNEELGVIQKWFVRYGGIGLLPVVGVQLYAIFIRVNDYGLTLLRYASMLMIGVALLFVANSIIRKKMSWVFIGMSIITVLAMVGPLNIVDVPNRNQEARLKQVLAANGMLDGDKIVNFGKEVSSEDAEKIISGCEYFEWAEGNRTEFVKDVRELDLYAYYYDGGPKHKSEYIDFYIENNTVDISGFSTVESCFGYRDSLSEYNLDDYFSKLVKEYGNGPLENAIMTVDIDDQTRIVFMKISIYLLDDQIETVNCEYYLLRR